MIVRANAHLTDEQIIDLKNKITSEIQRIEAQQRQIHQYGLEKDIVKDEVDDATESVMISMTARLSTRDNLYLKKLYKAMKEIEQGEYGVCKECGAEISFQRLCARLTSTLCLQCKEETEQEERQSVNGRRSKSLGQTIRFEMQ